MSAPYRPMVVDGDHIYFTGDAAGRSNKSKSRRHNKSKKSRMDGDYPVPLLSWKPFVIDDLLSQSSIDRMMEGVDERNTRRQVFPGFLEIASGKRFPGIVDCTSRGKGRSDYELGESLVSALLSKRERSRIESLYTLLARAKNYTGRVYLSYHVMLVEPGAARQPNHVDSDAPCFFYTCLCAMTQDNEAAGSTYFTDLKAEEQIRLKPKQAVVFDGKTFHYGEANESENLRAFFYIAVKDNSVDANTTGKNMEEDVLIHSKSAKLNDSDDVVSVGEFWELIPDTVRPDDRYVALIVDIFRIKNQPNSSRLTVRWFYTLQQAFDIIDDEETVTLMREATVSNEVFWSCHFDECSVYSALRQVNIHFSINYDQAQISARLYEGEYISHRSFDYLRKYVISHENARFTFNEYDEEETKLWEPLFLYLSHPIEPKPKRIKSGVMEEATSDRTGPGPDPHVYATPTQTFQTNMQQNEGAQVGGDEEEPSFLESPATIPTQQSIQASDQDEMELEEEGKGKEEEEEGEDEEQDGSEPDYTSGRHRSILSEPDDHQESEKDYEVDRIVAHLEIGPGDYDLKVRFKGYDSSWDLWHPESELLLSCPEKVKRYWRLRKKK